MTALLGNVLRQFLGDVALANLERTCVSVSHCDRSSEAEHILVFIASQSLHKIKQSLQLFLPFPCKRCIADNVAVRVRNGARAARGM